MDHVRDLHATRVRSHGVRGAKHVFADQAIHEEGLALSGRAQDRHEVGEFVLGVMRVLEQV